MVSQNEKNRPVAKGKVGRFQISVWKNKKLFKAKNGFDVEREVVVARACIQYSTFNKVQGTWKNQSIWCNPEELRDLPNALDKLNEDIIGDDVASDSEAQPACITCTTTTVE